MSSYYGGTLATNSRPFDALTHVGIESSRRFAGLDVLRSRSVLCAMVLAAGLGSRLRPLTELRTKALLPVGDRPALAFAVDLLRAAGVTRIVVNAHHRAQDLRVFARSHGVLLSEENELLGTAGGVAGAGPLVGPGDALVWNADILANIDVLSLVAAHGTTKRMATLVVFPRARGEGTVGTDGQGRIVRLRQRRIAEEVSGGDFLGVYVLSAELRACLPTRGCLITDVCLAALDAGAVLRAFSCAARWHDIGTPASYLEANLAWLDGRGEARWCGPRAAVAQGVGLERTVVGDGASVDGTGTLTRCVVWPGAQATAPLVDAIVTPERIVRI